MMAFTTPCSAKPKPRGWGWLALCLLLTGVQRHGAGRVYRDQSGDAGCARRALVASTRFAVQLNPTLVDALEGGVALSFKLEFQLTRPRLYAWWRQLADGFDATADQSYKLTYHALTQSWRVSVGSLYQSYPTLNDALTWIGAIRGWRVLPKSMVGKSRLSDFGGQVRLALDIAQLPRPFQLSALGAAEWKLDSGWVALAPARKRAPMRATMSVVATLGLIVLYLLAVSTGNASRLADYYWDIVALAGVLGMAMLGLIGRQLWAAQAARPCQGLWCQAHVAHGADVYLGGGAALGCWCLPSPCSF